MPMRHAAPMRGLWSTFVVVAMCAVVVPAAAQPPKQRVVPGESKSPPAAKKGDKEKGAQEPKVKNFDFNALDLNGRMRTPQLLYFLERANEELERASLEKRSFIPHMVRSVEEERL